MASPTGGPERPLPRLRRTPLFSERRKLSAGPAGWAVIIAGVTCLMLSITTRDVWTLPLLAVAGALIAAGTTFSIDLLVTQTEVRVVWWRLLVRHRLDLGEIQSVDTVIADNLVGYFGGYNSRTSLRGAMLSDAEGDQSVGNKAVRIRTHDGRVIQVGCWRPTRFSETVEAARSG